MANQWCRELLESAEWCTITLPISATPLENTSALWTTYVNWASRTHEGIVDVMMESMNAGSQIISLIIIIE